MTLSFDASSAYEAERGKMKFFVTVIQKWVLSVCTHKSQKPLKKKVIYELVKPRSQSICNEVKRKRKKSRQVWQNAQSIAITDMSGLKAFSSLTGDLQFW